MSRPEIDELLNDARLVMNYAIRTGRLVDDELPKTIAAIEAAGSEGAVPNLAPLITALNNGIRAIAPITLIQLRAGQSPFDAHCQKITRLFQASLCALAVVLAGFVAYFTQYLHQEETALKAIEEIENTHVLDKLTALRKMVQFENALEKKDRQYDEYHRAIRELRNLQDKISGSFNLVKSVAERAPFSIVGTLGFSPPAAEASSPGEQKSYSEEYKRVLAQSVPRHDASGKARAGDSAFKSMFDACDPDIKRAPGLKNGTELWKKQVLADSVDQMCFSMLLNLLFYLHPTADLSYRIQASMATLNGWVLPFLYGLLGATCFLMRNSLDPRTPNFDVFSLILRVLLGGIAGIIIGWFWVPSTPKADEIASITSVPFGLAFLTGFSIDILFSLLDRLNRTVTDAQPAPRPA
jgi:hypothetical protein